MFSSIKRAKSRKIFFAILALLSLLVGVACTQAPTRGWSGPTVASGPVAEEDTLFVGTLGGKVIALENIYQNPPTPLWPEAKEIGGSKGGGLFACGGGISKPMSTYGTPAIAGGKVYIGGYDGHVYSFTTDASGSMNDFDTDSSIIGSPIIADDTLFVGNSDGKLYALDLDLSPKPNWPFKTGDKIWATPAVYDGVVYIGSCDDKLYAIDIETGKEIWHFKAEGAFLSTPAIANDTIYIGACDRKFYAIEVATEDERQKALSRSGKEAAPSKAANWVFDKAKNWFWTQALVYNGKVWVGSLDKNVYAINENDPTDYFIACETKGVVQTPPVLMGVNHILVGSEDGNIWAIDPQIEGDSGRVLYSEAGEPILAPMYADQEKGILFFHAQDGTHTLYALKIEATDKVDELKVTQLWNRRTDK
jgi:outer membrane protein assembly factor BamB